MKKPIIFIVDDDPVDVLLLKKILKSDYQVIETSNSGEAIKVVYEEEPDLVLLDVMMPKRSGYTLCALIKSDPNTKHIPVVMVTGLSTEMNKVIGENMGTDGYLVKPIQSNKLRNTISELLIAKNQTINI